MRRVVALTVLVLAAAPAAAQAKAPVLQQLVVFKSGKAVAKKASSKGVLVKVGHHRCAAGTGTALALLARSKAGHLRLRDFGSCSRHARDGSGLFVSGIGSDRNKGQNGWTYKVGRRAATTGGPEARDGGRGGPERLVRQRPPAAKGPARDVVLLPPRVGRLPAHAGAEVRGGARRRGDYRARL